MLFQVEMDVHMPHSMSVEQADALKQAERARAQELQRTGIWRHLWRVAGRYSNVSVFDVPGPQDLHEILSSLPLFPFMDMRITALRKARPRREFRCTTVVCIWCSKSIRSSHTRWYWCNKIRDRRFTPRPPAHQPSTQDLAASPFPR